MSFKITKIKGVKYRNVERKKEKYQKLIPLVLILSAEFSFKFEF